MLLGFNSERLNLHLFGTQNEQIKTTNDDCDYTNTTYRPEICMKVYEKELKIMHSV